MSLKIIANYQVPETTKQVARAIFPDGNAYMQLYDTFGTLFEDGDFASLFSVEGQPAVSPVRLALVSILQYAEGLTDRQAATAVRTRIDWKYLLCLELTDRGFHYSVLSEFRSRLIQGGLEQMVLDKLLAHCERAGLLKARGRQRTDSTHVLGAIRAGTRIETVGETLRHALNTLAMAVPDWMRMHSQPEWVERYATRMEEYRLPAGQAERQSYAERMGADGLALLHAVHGPDTEPWLAQLPAVETLRQVWVQNYTWLDADHLRWRTADEIPPAARYISSPYDRDVRYSRKRNTSWVGYKVHMTETCEPDAPHLVCHVETTAAPVADDDMTQPIHSALQAKGRLPATHIVDTGYVTAQLLADSQSDFAVDLVGPTRNDYRWQAQQGQGFAAEDFQIDWAQRQAVCPAGYASSSWTPAVDKRSNEVIKIKFSSSDCAPCPLRSLCTRAKSKRRTITIRPEQQHKALLAARQRTTTDTFDQLYAARAGIEGTLSQAIRVTGLRRARYIGLAKTHLQHIFSAAAMNITRIMRWLDEQPVAQTRTSAFARIHAVATA
jgi:transposase